MANFEVDVEDNNKPKDHDILIRNYFGSYLQQSFNVTYIFISNNSNLLDFLNTITSRIIESFSKIETIPIINIDNKNDFLLKISTGELLIKINNSQTENTKETIWEVSFESNFVILEEFRAQFLSSLLGVSGIKGKYCVKDEISDLISYVAYPIVRELENLLREYLMRFFSKKIGSEWWKKNSSQKLKDQVSKPSHKNRTFNGILDMELYSLDFIELSELISGNFSEMDSSRVIQALENIENARENPEKFKAKIENLKSNFIGNWKKFFENQMGIKDFLSSWTSLYEIRCEVAHNGLINLKRFNRLIDYHKNIKGQLEQIINELKIIKTIEYSLLEEISNMKINFTRYDIKSLIRDRNIIITGVNFGNDEMSAHEFKDNFNHIRTELCILGKYKSTEFQVNVEEEDLMNSRPSIALSFKEFNPNVIGSLELGLKINKFK